ncbi:hypothetical protein N9164_06080 [Draconibacterium sp.]|nr:hypothetical protein [Draconibacterium sp.]
MKIRILFIVAILFLGACTSTMKYTWSKVDYEGKKFNKILVIVISSTEQGRLTAEDIIVKYLAKEDINSTNSFTTFPPDEKIENLSEEEIEKRILDGGYDGVLVTKLADANSREIREGGGTYYQPVTYRYRRSIRTGYMHMYEPEYYRQELTYVIESQLFNVEDEAKKESVVWSGQSEVTDPVSFESASEKYSKTLVKTLIKSGKIIN